jgi:hypothetical protein
MKRIDPSSNAREVGLYIVRLSGPGVQGLTEGHPFRKPAHIILTVMTPATILCFSLICVSVCSAGENSPRLACNIKAIDPAERPRYNHLVKRLRTATHDRGELSDGYTYKLDTREITLPEVAEWIAMERLCCPFLTFQLEVKGSDDSRLTLRGPVGAKTILSQEFPDKAE